MNYDGLGDSDKHAASGALDETDGSGHGRAALLLIESLIHILVEKSVLNTGDAVETVATATEVALEYVDELGDLSRALGKSLELLQIIGRSFQYKAVSPEIRNVTILPSSS